MKIFKKMKNFCTDQTLYNGIKKNDPKVIGWNTTKHQRKTLIRDCKRLSHKRLTPAAVCQFLGQAWRKPTLENATMTIFRVPLSALKKKELTALLFLWEIAIAKRQEFLMRKFLAKTLDENGFGVGFKNSLL